MLKRFFAFSSILVIYSFGFLHLENANGPSTEVDDLYQALELSRGVQQILKFSTPSIQDSSFSPLLDVRELERPVILPDEVQFALSKLYDANNTCGVRSTDLNTAVYQDTIERLEQALSGVYQDPILNNSAVRWAIELPRSFLERIQEREPMSLIILGGYCVILHQDTSGAFRDGAHDFSNPYGEH